MHHNTAKNVLHVSRERLRQMRPVPILESAQTKDVCGTAANAKTPFIDKTIYTGWNGMCISAYLAAGRGLGVSSATEFALLSLDRLLEQAWQPGNGALAHVVAYGDGVACRPAVVPGVLEDYGFAA